MRAMAPSGCHRPARSIRGEPGGAVIAFLADFGLIQPHSDAHFLASRA
jgi:hypothetical protein